MNQQNTNNPDIGELVDEDLEESSEYKAEPQYLTAEEAEFVFLSDNVGYGSSKLFELLKKVYIDDQGKEHIPDDLQHGKYQRTAKKLLLHEANKLVYLAFSSSPESPNIRESDYSIKRNVINTRIVNKHQKLRDMVRDKLAEDIVRAFPIQKLLEYNSLREDEHDVFGTFCNNRAKHYLLTLLQHRNGKAEKRKEHAMKRSKSRKYPRDNQSRNKPRCGCTVYLQGRVGHGSEETFIEDAYVVRDINRFLRSQQSKRNIRHAQPK